MVHVVWQLSASRKAERQLGVPTNCYRLKPAYHVLSAEAYLAVPPPRAPVVVAVPTLAGISAAHTVHGC